MTEPALTALYLLRHADALPFGAPGDFTRTLSDVGRKQVATLAATLAKKPLILDHVYCSAALRTVETWEGIKQHIACDHVTISEHFYNAPAPSIKECTDVHAGKSVLVVAHNPGIGELAYSLALTAGRAIPSAIASHYPPCTLTKYTLDGAKVLLVEVIFSP